MKKLATQIIIDAPTSDVWKVLMNHNEYPSWNPFIRSLQGSAAVGETLDVVIGAEGKKPMNFKPTVLIYEPEQEFRWLGHLFVKGLFDGEHFFKLERVSETQTLFTHGENFTGLLVKPLLKLVGDDTRTGFELMNNALKGEVERSASNGKL